MASHWMIYGANGYTGRLVAEQAQREGLTPLLGGRNPAALHALGSQLGLECRVFDLGDPQACREALDQVKVVAHCAGPFSATSTPMIAACRAAGTHYGDPKNGWQHWTSGRLDVIDVPGDHLVLMKEPYVETVAAEIAALLEPSTSSERTRP